MFSELSDGDRHLLSYGGGDGVHIWFLKIFTPLPPPVQIGDRKFLTPPPPPPEPGRIVQSVEHLIHQRSWVQYPVLPHAFFSPSAESRRAVVSYWRKYVHEVLVNRLGGLSLPRKSVVRLIDRPDITLDVYRGRKTTTTSSP